MTDNKSLHRIFSSSDANKYPTVGKLFQLQQTQPASTQAPAQDPQSQPAPTQVPVQTPVQAQPTSASNDQDLDLLDNLVSQAVFNKTNQTVDNQLDPQVGSRAKEVLPGEVQAIESSQTSPEQSVEAVEAIDQAHQETIVSPEVSELSKELKEVSKEVKEQREQAEIKDHQQEISDLANSANTPVAVSDKPVVVLPITEQSKEEAKFKSTKYSVRWLWEWCKKVAKMFSGAVIYKEEIENE